MSKFIVTTESRPPKAGERIITKDVNGRDIIGLAAADFQLAREVVVGIQELFGGESYHLYDAKHPHPDDPTIEAIFSQEVKLG